MTKLDATKFLEDLSGRYAKPYTEAIQDMLMAEAKLNKPAHLDARTRLEEVIRNTMGTAEVLGASIALQEAAKVVADEPEMEQFAARRDMSRFALGHFAAAPPQAILPRVTFEEAVEDMVERAPTTLKNAAERTAQNIAKLYGEGSGGLRRIAFVRAADAAVTSRVQALITEAIREGIEEAGAGRLINMTVNEIGKRTGAWSGSYSRMVFRTNLNTAVTAGKWKQGMDPVINTVMPAVEYLTAGDVDVRGNHEAGDGKIMLRTNPEWRRLAPPNGYSCRCDSRNVGTPELRRLGRLSTTPQTGFTRVEGVEHLFVREDKPPAGWHPDPNFRKGARPDLGI